MKLLFALFISISNPAYSSTCLKVIEQKKQNYGKPHFSLSYAELVSKATAYRGRLPNPDAIDAKYLELLSSFPWMARLAQESGRALDTELIKAADLPYSVTLRANQLSVEKFPKNVLGVRQIELAEVSDVVLWTSSSTKAPLNAYARLAKLKDGRPVALITHTGAHSRFQSQNRFEERVLSALLLSQLGVGVLFHGLYKQDLERSYVVDLMPGSPSRIENVTFETLIDRKTIIDRLRSVGIEVHNDYQEFSNEGRLLIIDPEGYILGSNFVKPAQYFQNGPNWTRTFTQSLVSATKPEVSLKFIDYLIEKNDPFLNEIKNEIEILFRVAYSQARPSSPIASEAILYGMRARIEKK